jgi:hypothetical protein
MATVYGNASPLPSAVVTNTKDSGPGSLRAALYYAFDKSTDVPPVPTTISFSDPNQRSWFRQQRFHDQTDLSHGCARLRHHD